MRRAWLLPALAVLGLAAPAAPTAAVPAVAGAAVAGAAASGAASRMCVAVRQEVVAWSRQYARAPGRAHVVSIRGGRQLANRVARSPENGVLLSCRGSATLSNGLRQPVRFGIRSIDNTWYLFLERIPRRR